MAWNRFRRGVTCACTPLLWQLFGCGITDGTTPAALVATLAQEDGAREESHLRFDLDANLLVPRRFYSLPLPSDLRVDETGRPMLAGMPRPDLHTLDRLAAAVMARRGFSRVSTAYFEVEGTLPRLDPLRLVAPGPTAPVLIIDIDPGSPGRGQLLPAVVATVEGETAYSTRPLLAVAPHPGVVLRASTRYAYVVQRSLDDGADQPLGVDPRFAALARGERPPGRYGRAAQALYAPLWPALRELGIAPEAVAAATVFTTGDPVGEVARAGDQVIATQRVALRDLALDPEQGRRHERFCMLRAVADMPQFQRGEPPFDEGGEFTGTVQRSERVPLVLTIPRRPVPPGGYPVVFYFHGTGGSSAQVVERGGLRSSPAHTLAQRGFVTVGVALPQNPERGGRPRDYRNLDNPGAYPGTFLQGVVEQRLLLHALERLRIRVDAVSPCSGRSVFLGRDEFQLDTAGVYLLGQSHGSAYAYLVGATEPRVRGVVLTGAGGYWGLHALEQAPDDALGRFLLGTQHVHHHLHPGVQLLQWAWEPADPVVFAPHLGREPLAGHPARSIYQPVGQGDSAFSERIFDAVTAAAALQRAGETVWRSTGDALFPLIHGMSPTVSYPVQHNLRALNGTPYTAVYVQFPDTGSDMHSLVDNHGGVRHQYGCFLETLHSAGSAVVAAPGGADDDCAEAPAPATTAGRAAPRRWPRRLVAGGATA
jgi:hypothetical protein